MPRKKKREPDPEEIGRGDARGLERSTERSPRHALAQEVELALTEHRWTHSLTQHQLADELGVKQPQVARLESGLVNPSLDTLVRISERLGIDFTIEVKSGSVGASSTRRGSRPA